MTGETGSPSAVLLSEADLSLNLDRQKREAKRLRDGLHAGDPAALARLQAHHPRAARLDPARAKLADAQLVIAREAGLSSWPALKAHVTGLDAACKAIRHGAPAPDGDLPTLHIRCGNDIEASLRHAGFEGEFLCHDDPLCDGPVRMGADHLPARAAYLGTSYPGVTAEDARRRMAAGEAMLSRMTEFARIVLWFEHDPYDQFCLADVLARLAPLPRRKVEMVALDRYPGLPHFIGLGQLAPAALRHVFAARQPVPEPAFAAGLAARAALAASDPLALMALAESPSPALPFLPGAIRRHLAELPDPVSGLGFSERAALQLIADRAQTWGLVFHGFMTGIDPLPFFGDLMFLALLLRLSRAGNPPLRFCDDPMQGEWGKAQVELTETGRRLLAGTLDFSACSPEVRHVGGITCFSGADWRWDGQAPIPHRADSAGRRR